MKKNKQKAKNRFGATPYLFTLPGVILFVLIVIIPVFETLYLSFTNWDGVKPLSTIHITGINNYKKILTDPVFFSSIKNNLIWAVFSVTVPIFIGLIQAQCIINSKVRGKNLFQLLLFLPQILSSIVMSIMWLAIYDPASGLLNGLLNALNLPTCAWLGDKNTALACLIIVSIWGGYGFNTILYCTAMRSVDTTMYEAARIDGASSSQIFFKIIIPTIRPTTMTLILLSLIGAFKVFDTVFQMTKGGPGYYTYVMSYYLYTSAFTSNKIGFGCAMAVIQTVLVLGISFVYQRFIKDRNHE